MEQPSLQAKWQDYLFLTCEMHKFLERSNMDMFYTLMAQRTHIQSDIRRIAPQDALYHASPDGQQLLRQIQLAEQELNRRFSQKFNLAKQQKQVAQAYDGLASYAGRYINRRT